MDIVKESIRVSQYVGHKSFVELVEGDIIVPDIKPDILSLIKVMGRAFITDKETMDENIKLKGYVEVYAIYIADDETNSLKGISATLNFEETVDVENAIIGMIPIVKYSMGNIESRVLNGRKISVKCPIEIDLKLMRDEELAISKEVTEAENIQVMKESIQVNALVGYNKEDVTINENISLPENTPSIGEILSSTVDIVNTDYKISYNKVLAKADAKVRIIYIADDTVGSVQTFETLIPFTGFVDINGVNDNTKVDLDYNLKSVYIKPVYQDMKANGISIEAKVEMFLIAHEVRDVDAIQDMYNPDEVLSCDINEIEIEQSNNHRNDIVRIDQVLSIPELDYCKLLDVNIKASITDKKQIGEKVMVDGTIAADILYYNLDKKTIESKKIEVPFQENVLIGRNNSVNDITVDVVEFEYELRNSGQLRINIGLVFNNSVVNKLSLNVIDNVKQTDERIMPIASVVIYPVKVEDTLWKIAKKFRTTVEDIKQANGLNDDTIYPMQQLIIPKRVYKMDLTH